MGKTTHAICVIIHDLFVDNVDVVIATQVRWAKLVLVHSSRSVTGRRLTACCVALRWWVVTKSIINEFTNVLLFAIQGP